MSKPKSSTASQTELSPETLPAHVEELSAQMLTEDRLRRFEQVLAERLSCLTVILEDLYDPNNISACIRSCEVFGCSEVQVLTRKHRYQTKHGISRNATLWVDIHRHRTLPDCLAKLRAEGFTLVGTLPEGKGVVPYDQLVLPEKLCLVMGQEHTGLSDDVLAACETNVTIPQYGFTQSLNISVALGILLAHFSRRYRQRGGEIHLSPARKAELLFQWKLRDLKRKFGWQGLDPGTPEDLPAEPEQL